MKEKHIIPHTELTAARLKRQSIDREAQLLHNKITLLKHAELRALKSTEQKRKRDQIDTMAQMNKQEKLEHQEALRRLKDLESDQKLQTAKKNREKNKSSLNLVSQYLLSRAHSEAQLLKQNRAKNLQIINQMKQNELAEKKIFSSQVRNSVREAQEKRKKLLEEKRNVVKSEMKQKILQEFLKIKEKEQTLENLEKEQLKIIERLNLVKQISSHEESEVDSPSFKYKLK